LLRRFATRRTTGNPESLGASVHLKPRASGKGSVVIDYSSLDELSGIVKRLKRS